MSEVKGNPVTLKLIWVSLAEVGRTLYHHVADPPQDIQEILQNVAYQVSSDQVKYDSGCFPIPDY